jgi:hypothetical protein
MMEIERTYRKHGRNEIVEDMQQRAELAVKARKEGL